MSRLALCFLVLATPRAAQEPGARVDSLFSHLDEGVSPGLAVAVVRDGEVVLREGFGLASLEHRVPITSSTVFDVASVSKQFTGLAVAMLVEQGRVDLDDDIRSWIPELPDFGPTITVRHLLHHTSGLRDWPGALSIAGWRYDDVISYEQILRMAYAQEDLNFEPGSEYTYSNTGYNLLAELVARVTGTSFREWTEANLFRPLGMTRTHFHDDHTEVIADRAFGYARARDGSYRRASNNLTALGSSSLYSTVDDLAKWLINFERATVGGPSALALTRTRGVLDGGDTIPYAFGISHGQYRGLPTLGHGGSWAQFSTYVVHFPEQRLGVVVLSNSGSNNAQRAASQVVDILLEDALGPPEAPAAADVARVEVSPALLEAYAGVYRLGPGWFVRIRRDGSALRARATREDEVAMTPRSERAFWVEAYGALISFERDADGPVTHLAYRGMRAPRVGEGEAPAPSPDVLAQLAGRYESGELDASYVVEVDEGGLLMRHRRHGTIRLEPAWGDEFVGSTGFIRAVTFRRDADGRVVGLLVNAGERNRDLWFMKVR
ncbi:MAG TPA: serine hydrolase [Longimicrobiales bacterium]|nr:serine hydrolase [Longimicrobiales bacterium]